MGALAPLAIGSGAAASGAATVEDGGSSPIPIFDPIGSPTSDDVGSASATGATVSGMMRGAITGMGATARGAVAGAAARGRAVAGLGVPRAGGGATAGMKGIINLGACAGKGLGAMLAES